MFLQAMDSMLEIAGLVPGPRHTHQMQAWCHILNTRGSFKNGCCCAPDIGHSIKQWLAKWWPPTEHKQPQQHLFLQWLCVAILWCLLASMFLQVSFIQTVSCFSPGFVCTDAKHWLLHETHAFVDNLSFCHCLASKLTFQQLKKWLTPWSGGQWFVLKCVAFPCSLWLAQQKCVWAHLVHCQWTVFLWHLCCFVVLSNLAS